MKGRMWSYLVAVAKEYGTETNAIGGTEDHVHLVVTLPPKIAVAVLVRVLKANSSKWMNEEGHLFAWQSGYGAFSVSASNLSAVCEYVRNQEKQHAKIDWKVEFETLLRKHGIAYTSGSVAG
jgi:REP element-mobilizing transposase RayT